MIDGSSLWEKEIIGDMVQAPDNSGKIFTNLPENLFAAMKKMASAYPTKTALIDDEGRKCSYRCFLERCEELAAYLYEEKGVKPGSHVGIMMHNTVEYCVAFYALSRIGAVMVSLPSKFKATEVDSLAKQSDMEFLICEEEYAGWFAGICSAEKMVVCGDGRNNYGYERIICGWRTGEQKEIQLEQMPYAEADAAALMMFTSGTTSQSKAVLLKNRHIMHAVECYRRILEITDEDISVIATPIYHITGLIALLGLFLSSGATLYLHRKFDADRLVREARNFGFTFIHASPTVFQLFLQAGEHTEEITTLRSFACGSSNMPGEKIMRLHRWLPKAQFHTVYGLTETSSPATIFPGDAAKSPYIGASGRPIPGTWFKIVDENLQELPIGEIGEIAVKGRNVMEGYYGEHAQLLKDGWLCTGDIGYFNEEKYLYVVDRKKNMINRGGEKIWCYDVENEMERMPGIRNAAVVGIPDELYGEVAAAVVELEMGISLSAEAIQEYLKTRMARYKIPVVIKTVESIPQTPNGKPDKAAIKKMMMEA